MESVFIEPGSLWENEYVDSFNGKSRDECLNAELFWGQGEAQTVLEWWRRGYNEARPHSALNYQTPEEVAVDFMKTGDVEEERQGMENKGIQN